MRALHLTVIAYALAAVIAAGFRAWFLCGCFVGIAGGLGLIWWAAS